MARLGRTLRLPIAVDPAVANESIDPSIVQAYPARDAVDVVASKAKCHLEPLPGGGWYVSRPSTITMAIEDGDVRDVLALIKRFADEEIVVLPDVRGTVSIDVLDVPWRDALTLVARACDLHFARGRWFTLVGKGALPPLEVPPPFQPPLEPRVDVHVDTHDLATVFVEMFAGQLDVEEIERANAREDHASAAAAWARIQEQAERLRAEEEEIFHRNAEALYLRGKYLFERTEKLADIRRRFGPLMRVTAIVLPGDDSMPKSAIVGSSQLREGDHVLDPRTDEPIEGLRVVEIQPTRVRFRFEDTEVFRELGRE